MRASLTSSSSSVDASLLRHALRLIHCMQKERGASCACCSSAAAAASQQQPEQYDQHQYMVVQQHPQPRHLQEQQQYYFIVTMEAARKDTDVAIRLFQQYSSLRDNNNDNYFVNEIDVRKTIERIRHLIDNNKNRDVDMQDEPNSSSNNSNGLGFHRILVMFNTLISSVVHEYILRHVAPPLSRKARSSVKRLDATSSLLSRLPSPKETASMLSTSVPNQQHEKAPGPPPFDLGQPPPPPSGMKPSTSSPCLWREAEGYASYAAAGNPVGGILRPSSSLSSSPMDDLLRVSFLPTSNSHQRKNKTSSPKTSQDKIQSLLSLLGCFVRLKESTGKERAALSSILAMGVVNRGAQDRMLNDLVLEVENQHSIVHELLRSSPEQVRLMALIRESVEYGPQMAALQQKILLDFDLVGFQQDMGMEEFWDLITVYMDRLHSLELLIIEELECSLELGVCGGRSKHGTAESNKEVKANSVVAPENGVDSGVLAKLLQEASVASSPGGGVKRTTTATTTSRPNDELVRQQIESMTPEQVKDKILSWLSQQQQNGTKTESATSIDAARTAVATTTPLPAAAEASSERTASNKQLQDSNMAAMLLDAPGAVAASSYIRQCSKEWEINLYELQFQKRIGRGSAGTTYLASWTGQAVAVKVAAITEMGLEGWKTEVHSLSRLHHPNIIRLLGSVYNPSPLTYCLVLEYCDAGDLESALHQPTPPNFFFRVATSIANGMAYLHSRGIIHRDIKPGNVLLHGDVKNGNFSVKVNDFGVAATFHSKEHDDDGTTTGKRTAETGTYRWMAPEVIRHESYSNMADVYSFACLMWQLITREDPFGNFSQIEAAGMVALEQARPPFPEQTPHSVETLIATCWDEDPQRRLPFDDVSKSLKELLLEEGQSSLTAAEKHWLEEPRGHAVYKKKKKTKQRTEIKSIPLIPPQAPNRRRGSGPAVNNTRTLIPPRHDNNNEGKKTSFRRIFSRQKSK